MTIHQLYVKLLQVIFFSYAYVVLLANSTGAIPILQVPIVTLFFNYTVKFNDTTPSHVVVRNDLTDGRYVFTDSELPHHRYRRYRRTVLLEGYLKAVSHYDRLLHAGEAARNSTHAGVTVRVNRG